MKKLFMPLLCAVALTAHAANTVDVTQKLQNPDFESCSYTSWVTNCPGWNFAWGLLSNPWPAKYDGSWEAFGGGNYYLNLYGASASEGLVAFQQVEADTTATYTLSVDAYADVATNCLSLYLSNGDETVMTPISGEGDVNFTASISAKQGQTLTIGIYTATSATAVWGYADNFKLTYTTAEAAPSDGDELTVDGHTYRIDGGQAVLTSADTDTYLRGADISELSYVESLGAKFRDADGRERDALDILQENGINTVRLRLYNHPGNEVTYGGNTYAMPAGFLDEADVLSLAKRAKDHGMKIELTFHYSDFWTNGEMQFKTKAWEDCSLAALKDSIYTYTKSVLEHMKVQGTAPDYVSLGNEIQAGMLFGYYTSVASLPEVNGYCNDMPNLQNLLSRGSAAVREVCPDAKIIIHLTMSTGVTANTYAWFFSRMKSLDYDMIGASYYPYWTGDTPANTLQGLITKLNAADIDKDIMIMETGYAWMRYRPYGRYGSQYEGQLHLNGDAYNEASREGQKQFMEELQTVIKSTPRIKGYYYWDPVMVEQKVDGQWIKTGWVAGGDNQVGNTTLFDYSGKALPALDAIRADYIPSSLTIGGTTYSVARTPHSDPSGITGVSASSATALPACYNLCGMRVQHPAHGIYVCDGKKVAVK